MSEKAITVIDTMSQVYRAYYAIRGLSTAAGQPTNAVFGFASMLQKILRAAPPPYLAAATDLAAPTLRHAAYAQYKANRKPTPDDLVAQIPAIFELFRAFRIPVLGVEGYEADDLIAAMAERGRRDGFTVTILTSDKDLFQLVDDRVFVLDTKSDTLYGPEQVVAKLGIRPDQVVDYLALTGDTADNIPGAPGIGPKTAQSLLAQFQTLDNCLAHVNEITPPRVQGILSQHRQQILDSRELARLQPRVPIQWEWEDFHRQDPDPVLLRELFTRMEFRTLLKELPPPSGSIAGATLGIEDAEPLRQLRRDQPDLPLALLTAGKNAICLQPQGDSRVFILDQKRDHETIALLLGSGPARFHQLKPFCLHFPPGAGFESRMDDAALMHYLLYPHQEDHSLEKIAADTAGIVLDASVEKAAAANPLLHDANLDAGVYRTRAEAIHASCKAMAPAIASHGLEQLYHEMELPLVPVLAGMEKAGILLDTPYLLRLSAELAGKIAAIEDTVYILAGERFNINSPKQLGEILFEKLQIPSLKKTKKTKSYATGVEVLEQLAQEFELPARILEYRQLAKLKSTYVDALPRLVNPATGRLHTTFHQTVAATGRLSSANPNLQNIPIRTEEGQKIRRAFIAPPGFVLVAADYSQIELRVMAHLSGDERLIAAFHSGLDIHTQTARDTFGAQAESNPAEYRRRAKIINYSILYGKSDFGLSQDLKISRLEARQIIDAYFAAYPDVRRWVEENLERARREGVVRTLFGRIRPMPELARTDKMLQKAGERIATNAPVQGTAADIIKMAMIRLDRVLTGRLPRTRLLLQVHDELVLETPAEDVVAVTEVLREAMQDVAALAVPLIVDIHSGKNWMEAKE